MLIRDFIKETTAGAVASIATGLGGGDPTASIYHDGSSQKKKKKNKMIRRPPMEKKQMPRNKISEISAKKVDDYRQKAFQDQPAGDDGSDRYRKRKAGRDMAFDKVTGRARVKATEDVAKVPEVILYKMPRELQHTVLGYDYHESSWDQNGHVFVFAKKLKTHEVESLAKSIDPKNSIYDVKFHGGYNANGREHYEYEVFEKDPNWDLKEATELKSFKVTYKTKKGETSVTVKARDKEEAKAKVRRRPNYQGNAVATLGEAVVGVTTGDTDAWTLGYVAGKKGKGSNPYAKGSKDSDDWNKGKAHATSGTPATHKRKVKESQLTEGVLDDHDDDGFMAKRQLYDLAKYAVELHRMIQDTDNLEPWVQAKITKASDYISTVKHYLEYNSVRDAEDMADMMGPKDLADIDMAPLSQRERPVENEIMEYGDEEEGSQIYPEDVLRWAYLRGVISGDAYDTTINAESGDLWDVAENVANWIGIVYEVGGSDISIWMKDFVETCKHMDVKCDGPKSHIYESELKAKMIYKNMLRELRETK